MLKLDSLLVQFVKCMVIAQIMMVVNDSYCELQTLLWESMINESHVEVLGDPGGFVNQQRFEKFDLFHLGPLEDIFLSNLEHLWTLCTVVNRDVQRKAIEIVLYIFNT